MAKKEHIPVLVKLALVGSFVLDVASVITSARSAMVQGSALFVFLAIYYFALAVMTLVTARVVFRATTADNLGSEFRGYRLCGAILFVLNLLVTVIVASLISGGAQYTGSDIWLTVMMVYSVIAALMSLAGIVTLRKYGSPLLSAFNAVGLTASLVSVLLNETAVLDLYSGLGDGLRIRIIAVTGVVIFGAVLIMSLFMVLRGMWNLRKLDRTESKGLVN